MPRMRRAIAPAVGGIVEGRLGRGRTWVLRSDAEADRLLAASAPPFPSRSLAAYTYTSAATFDAPNSECLD